MFDCIKFLLALTEWRLSLDTEYINKFKNSLNIFKQDAFQIMIGGRCLDAHSLLYEIICYSNYPFQCEPLSWQSTGIWSTHYGIILEYSMVCVYQLLDKREAVIVI